MQAAFAASGSKFRPRSSHVPMCGHASRSRLSRVSARQVDFACNSSYDCLLLCLKRLPRWGRKGCDKLLLAKLKWPCQFGTKQIAN